MRGGGVVGGDDVLRSDADPRHRRRREGNRLGRRVLLAGDVAGGHRPLLDAVDGLARLAVQDEHPARLADLREGGNALAVPLDLEQAGRRRQVVVPQLVVDVLEVPRQLAGRDVEGDGRVREEVVAGAVAAVEVRAGAADGHVDEAPLLVDGEGERPHVVPDAVAPALVAPGLAAEVGLGGQGRELPPQVAGRRVEGPRIGLGRLSPAPGLVQVGRDVVLSGAEGARAQDQGVLVDHRDPGVGDAQRRLAPVAEREVALARVRVQGDDLRQAGEVDAGLVGVGGRPVGDAAERRQPLGQLVPPDLLAGLGPQGHDPVPRREVHDAVDHDRRHLLEELGRARPLDEPVLGMEPVRPDLLERADVRGVDLVEGRVARPREVPVVGRPVGGGAPPRLLRQDRCRRRQDGSQRPGRHARAKRVPAERTPSSDESHGTVSCPLPESSPSRRTSAQALDVRRAGLSSDRS